MDDYTFILAIFVIAVSATLIYSFKDYICHDKHMKQARQEKLLNILSDRNASSDLKKEIVRSKLFKLENEEVGVVVEEGKPVKQTTTYEFQ